MKFKNTLKVLASSVLLFGTVGLATSCNDDTTPTQNVTTDVNGMILNQNGKVIREDFTLASKYLGCDLTWTSSNSDVAKIEVGSDGTITCKISRPASRTEVTLTATSGKYSKDYKIIVNAIDAEEIADEYSFTHSNKTLTSGSYDLPSTTSYGGVTANIEWSVPDEYAEFAKVENGKLVVTAVADVKNSFKVKATFSYNGETANGSYNVHCMDSSVTNDICTEVKTGVPYILMVNQEQKGYPLYFAGTVANTDYYLKTTTNKDEATLVYIEANGEGYSISFTNPEGAKQYIIAKIGEHANLGLASEASTVWNWDTEHNCFVTVNGEEKYYFGTYSSFDTLSLSKYSYISTSYPNQLTPVTSAITEPEENVEYNLVIDQTQISKVLYSLGVIPDSSYYSSTTEDINKSIPYKLEKVEGGWNISLTVGGAKKYLNAVTSSTYVNVKFEDTATTVYTWNKTHNTLTVTINNTEYFFGTRNTYDTMGFYEISNIEEYFKGYFTYNYGTLIVDSNKEDNKDEEKATDSIQVGTEYYMYMINSSDETLYFNGKTSEKYDYYGATTTKEENAVKVLVEANGDGYNIYFMSNGAKKYIVMTQTAKEDNSGYFTNFGLSDTASRVWSWNKDHKTFTAVGDLNNETYYLGTSGTYGTISLYDISTIETNSPCLFADPNATTEGEGSGEGSGEGETTKFVETTLELDTEYLMWLDQTTNNKKLYFAGEITSSDYGNFAKTTENSSEASTVKIELNSTKDGYLLYFMDGETKKYINIDQHQGTSKVVQYIALSSDSTTNWYWNSDNSTFYAIGSLDSKNYYIGTYSTYNTFCLSNIDYISSSGSFHVTFTKPADLNSGNGDSSNGGGESPTEATLITIADALKKAEGTEVIVEGKITEVGDSQYKIADSTGSIVVSGTIAEIGDKTLGAGDTIKIKGTRNTYSGTYPNSGQTYTIEQIVDATLLNYTQAEVKDPLVYDDIQYTEIATISFADKDTNRESQTGEQQVWKMNGITFTNDKASSGNNVGDFGNPVRCYTSSNITIANDSEFNIIVIKFTGSATNRLHADDVVDGANFALSDDGLTAILVLDDKTNSFSYISLPRQFRISEIIIGTLNE